MALDLVLAVVRWWWPRDSLCASHKVFGWASLQKKVKPLPSALSIPEDLAGVFWGLASQGVRKTFFQSTCKKGKKTYVVILQMRGLTIKKNKLMHAEA